MEQGLGRLWNKLASTPLVSSSNSPVRGLQPSIKHSKSYVWDLQKAQEGVCCRPSGLWPWRTLEVNRLQALLSTLSRHNFSRTLWKCTLQKAGQVFPESERLKAPCAGAGLPQQSSKVHARTPPLSHEKTVSVSRIFIINFI